MYDSFKRLRTVCPEYDTPSPPVHELVPRARHNKEAHNVIMGRK